MGWMRPLASGTPKEEGSEAAGVPLEAGKAVWAEVGLKAVSDATGGGSCSDAIVLIEAGRVPAAGAFSVSSHSVNGKLPA